MNTINVGEIIKSSGVNGPGNRFVIWVQGCYRKCKNCSNQEFISHKIHKLYIIEELFNDIKKNRDSIEGVTYSGGEPFEQAESLFLLGEKIKAIGLTLFCYTGYTLDHILKSGNNYQQQLVNILDVLVDGAYQEENKANLLWRGSSNQVVHILTPCYKAYLEKINIPAREIEIIIKNGQIVSTGFPK